MNVSIFDVLHLLHRCSIASLATHSRQPAGFPYPTVLPIATDRRHFPVMLVSRLAEHTRNLADDSRAGLVVFDADAPSLLEGARLTLLGVSEVVSGVESDAAHHASQNYVELAARYLRYHPSAQKYLALGDFQFVSLVPARLRYIGGFGNMGWLEAAELDGLALLDAGVERAVLTFADLHSPSGTSVLGVDAYGADLNVAGMRRRVAWPETTAIDRLQEQLRVRLSNPDY